VRDLGGISFVLLLLAFVGCLLGGGAATLTALALQGRGRPAAARVAERWATGLGVGAAVCLLGAGALFARLSR
jgi:hypothetical protein